MMNPEKAAVRLSKLADTLAQLGQEALFDACWAPTDAAALDREAEAIAYIASSLAVLEAVKGRRLWDRLPADFAAMAEDCIARGGRVAGAMTYREARSAAADVVAELVALWTGSEGWG